MPHRIMIVDDEPDIRLYLRAALEDAGYAVCERAEAAAFVDAVRTERPDVICLDIMMPGQSGIALYRQLAATADLCHIPVLLVTGMTPSREFVDAQFEALVADAQVRPPAGVVEKPIRIPDLLATIEGVLAGRSAP